MIDASSVQVILAVIALISTVVVGWQQITRTREQRAAAKEKAELQHAHKEKTARLELEKIEAEARAETDRAKADKAIAEARRIANDSEGELVKAHAEANQMNQVSQLMVSQQLMLTDAFKQISADSAQNRLVYDRVAENLGRQTEAIAMISVQLQAGHRELKTELEGLSTVILAAMRDFPNTVDAKVTPLSGHLRNIEDTLVRLNHLVQSMQLALRINPEILVTPTEPITPVTTETTTS